VTYDPSPSIRIIRSTTFDAWFTALRDRRAKARIAVRIRRLSIGNPGDTRSVGSGITELRIDYDPGYRVYFRDIRRAIEIAARWR